MGNETVFEQLDSVDISDMIRTKNNFKYLPWSTAWTEIIKRFPTAVYEVVKDVNGCIYHTDGKTCWVETSVEIDGVRRNETLAVLNHKNQPIALEAVTSFNAGNSIKRCLVKNLALFGLGIGLWTGEELSDSAKNARLKKTVALSEKQAYIIEVCKSLTAKDESIKDALYAIIELYNGGNKNPKSIKSIEVCDMILDKIAEEYDIDKEETE